MTIEKQIKVLLLVIGVLILLVLSTIFGCNSKKDLFSDTPVNSGKAFVAGVITRPNGTKIFPPTGVYREIIEGFKYDTLNKGTKNQKIKRRFISDTLYGLPVYNYKADSTKKYLLLDSNGNVMIDSANSFLIQVSKDSVRWRGIEGIPLRDLLDKKAPLR